MPSVKVGVLNDLSFFFSSGNSMLKLFLDAYQLAFDEAFEDGIIDRRVELVVQNVDGLPTGNIRNVIDGWKKLAAEGVVGVIGPFTSDNVLDLRDYVEEFGHIPNLSYSGSDKLYGDWVFGVTDGSLSEEPYLMANFLAHQNPKAGIGVIYENNAIGQEYLTFMHDACRYEGLRIVGEKEIGQLQDDLTTPLRELRDAGTEAIAFFGFGRPAMRINASLAELNWDPLRVMGTAFLAVPFLEDGIRTIKGWCGVDQYDESNTIGQDLIDRFDKRYGYRPLNCALTVAYDAANLLANGIAKAHPLSPAGVRRGLDRVKMLPAASGGAGTLMSFAPFVRRAWLGPDYLVIRKATTDEPVTPLGDLKTELVHRYKARTRGERRR